MGCPGQLIQLYSDKEVTPAQKIQLENHLAGCVRCRDELQVWQSLNVLVLDSALDYGSSESVEGSLWQKIHTLRRHPQWVVQPVTHRWLEGWMNWVAEAVTVGVVAMMLGSGTAWLTSLKIQEQQLVLSIPAGPVTSVLIERMSNSATTYGAEGR